MRKLSVLDPSCRAKLPAYESFALSDRKLIMNLFISTGGYAAER